MEGRYFEQTSGFWSNVRKFGVDRCDLPTMMWNVSFLLRFLTLNIDSRHTKPAPIYLKILMVAIISCYFYVYLVSMVWFVFWRCRQTGDVIAAMIVFSLGMSSEIGTAKLVFMFIQNDSVKKIVTGYLESDALIDPNSRFAINVLKTLKVVKKRAVLFWITIISNGIIYSTKPLLMPGRHMMEEVFIYLGLEPMLETPNYQIAFLITLLGIIQTVYPPSGISAFFIAVVGYTEAQMLALAEELNCLWDDASISYANQQELNNHDNKDENDFEKVTALNDYVKNKLAVIAKIHTRNIVLIQQVERVLQGIVLAEFLLLNASLISELLGGLENTYLLVPFAMMQVSMDCLTGQRLMDASFAFETAVYNCKWENFNKSNMKTVLLMLQMSQKEMKLSAGGITSLNFMCLMSVVRSVYSAYTTLEAAM